MGVFSRTKARAAIHRKFDEWMHELGWPIDERHENSITLYFNGDQTTPRREVKILSVGGGQLLSFFIVCRAIFRTNTLPDNLLPGLLARNKDVMLGSWYAAVTDKDDLGLILRYAAPTASMNANFLAAICSSLLSEVAEVENSLHRKGLL